MRTTLILCVEEAVASPELLVTCDSNQLFHITTVCISRVAVLAMWAVSDSEVCPFLGMLTHLADRWLVSHSGCAGRRGRRTDQLHL